MVCPIKCHQIMIVSLNMRSLLKSGKDEMSSCMRGKQCYSGENHFNVVDDSILINCQPDAILTANYFIYDFYLLINWTRRRAFCPL
jgi:hypothetical protein